MSESLTEKTVHLLNLGFTVRARADRYRADFQIYDIVALPHTDKSGIEHGPGWTRAGATEILDWVSDLDEARVFAHGRVKWDGCSDWHFDEQEQCMLHGCSRRDIQRIGDVLGKCWDLASELIPSWHGRDLPDTLEDLQKITAR